MAKTEKKKNSKDGQKSAIKPSVVEVEVLGSSDSRNKKTHEVLEDIIISDSKELIPMPSTDLTKYDQVTDPLTAYIRSIQQYDLLSPEQEKALTKALVETGDINIAKKLVMANLRLVVKIAMEYRNAHQNVMDLIQEGNIGLMKAVSKYDPDKGAKLSYYASWWIKSYILKFILDNFRMVKMGSSNDQKKLFYNLIKEKDRLSNMGITPDAKAISESLGVSEKAVVQMEHRLGETGGEVSIDTPIGAESTSTLGDLLPAEIPDIEDQISDKQDLELLKNNLKGFIDGLKERDQEIFKARLLSEAPLSLQRIADQYGVSRERIRQIEERLLNQLKVYMSEYIR